MAIWDAMSILRPRHASASQRDEVVVRQSVVWRGVSMGESVSARRIVYDFIRDNPGMTNFEIAERTGISIYTVENSTADLSRLLGSIKKMKPGHHAKWVIVPGGPVPAAATRRGTSATSLRRYRDKQEPAVVYQPCELAIVWMAFDPALLPPAHRESACVG